MEAVVIYGNTENEQILKALVEESVKDIHVIRIHAIEEIKNYVQAHSEQTKILLHSKYSLRQIDDTCNKLREAGVLQEQIYITPINTINRYMYHHMLAEREELFVLQSEFVQICGLNVHVVDHCNLHCKACSHSASLVDGEIFSDLSSYQKDLKRLSEICENICSIVLLGGEPLLNPSLHEFIEVSREIYPYAGIRIITNGVLLPSMNKKLIDTIKKYHVKVSVSIYPPMKPKMEEYETYLSKQGMNYELCCFDQFEKKLVLDPYFNGSRMVESCEECVVLRNGRLSRCVMGTYIDYFNHYFHTKLPKDPGIDLYDFEMTGNKMMDMLRQPIKLCSYCSMGYGLEMVPWEGIKGAAKPEDFLVK